MAVDDWINMPAEQNQGWGARWNAWMNRLVKYLRNLDKSVSFVPTVTQGVGVAITVDVIEYIRVGNTIHGHCSFTFNGAGTPANQIFVSAPLTRRSSVNVTVGDGAFFGGGNNYPLEVYLSGPSTFAFFHTHLLNSYLGIGAFAGGVAVGNTLSFSFTYPV